jgi:chromosomal replication initiation ATPase DnaA
MPWATARSSYADIGLLLAGEIQSLPGEAVTQAGFLRIFAMLHGGGRQVVIAAGRAPAGWPAWTTASAAGSDGAWQRKRRPVPASTA